MCTAGTWARPPICLPLLIDECQLTCSTGSLAGSLPNVAMTSFANTFSVPLCRSLAAFMLCYSVLTVCQLLVCLLYLWLLRLSTTGRASYYTVRPSLTTPVTRQRYIAHFAPDTLCTKHSSSLGDRCRLGPACYNSMQKGCWDVNDIAARLLL